ncbi:MAG: HEAT repeat domain-containing protein [Terracidiphilus sp.]
MSAKRTSRSELRGSSSRSFDKELAELEVLKGATLDAEAIEKLRKALGHRNNFVVSKAAKLVEANELSALLPEVLAAYDRFFEDAEKADPQCWAKNALVKALVKLEHRDKDAYLRGLRHHQMEGTWGGTSDTAGTLRGACAHALVNCPGISDRELLATLLELFADADKAVRVEAARAIGNIGGPSAALLLRLRALLGKDEPEVLGACYSGLLSLDGSRAIPFVARYLEDGDDTSAEAAFALSETHSPEAMAALIARRREGADSWFGSVLLSAIALCRLPEAMDYLLAIIERDERDAPVAIEAIGRTAPSAELRTRVERTVRNAANPRLEQAFRQHLPAPPERG